ncbi:hypothetical protein C7C46_31870 [Streptomyces tateyamensis]|uniref:Uncharacterized protein n=1 Tax=Streptomyces tateyamensis TaxID=565073 RepID=A0A2V4NH49_9ACTN|nr:hypothetical protein [Streptomyces tateyamensis]PYC66040.1 hypothetical protein C7C46_31870 [Streptomyces tateyamensis]
MTPSITARAQAALDYLETASTDPAFAHPARPEDAATAQLRLAHLLGIPLTNVTVTADLLRRRHQSGEPLLLTATDPADGENPQETYHFILSTPLLDHDPFHLLEPCPECDQPVPVRAITRLTDLAPALTRDLPDDVLDNLQFLFDPAHRDTCDFGPARD